MRSFPRLSLLITTCLALAACATATSGREPAPGVPVHADQSATQSRNDIITSSDLGRLRGANTVGDVVRQLRPQFMTGTVVRATAGSRVVPPVVYLNGRFLGGIEELEAIPMASLLEARRMRYVEARLAFGPLCRCEGGVIALREGVRYTDDAGRKPR